MEKIFVDKGSLGEMEIKGHRPSTTREEARSVISLLLSVLVFSQREETERVCVCLSLADGVLFLTRSG